MTGSGSKCPLCQHTLSDDGVESPDVFPRIETISHTHGLLLRCLLFGLISVSIVAVMLDWMFPDKTFWSGFAVAGAACVWISVRIAITGRGNIMKKLLNLSILISPLSVIWDIATGWHRWSMILFCLHLSDGDAGHHRDLKDHQDARRTLSDLSDFFAAIWADSGGFSCGRMESGAAAVLPLRHVQPAAFFGASRF